MKTITFYRSKRKEEIYLQTKRLQALLRSKEILLQKNCIEILKFHSNKYYGKFGKSRGKNSLRVGTKCFGTSTVNLCSPRAKEYYF